MKVAHISVAIFVALLNGATGFKFAQLKPIVKSPNILSRRRYSSELHQSLGTSTVYPINSLSKSTSSNTFSSPAGILWNFSRPHTLIGTFLSVVCVFSFAVPRELRWQPKFVEAVVKTLIPSFLMNIFVTGLNQITDVSIDQINKPYLPIPSGQLTINAAIAIVSACFFGSLFLARNSPWPLQMTLIGTAILGVLYSLPPFRFKRYPILAAVCILLVRGSLINLGFLYQAKSEVMMEYVPNVWQALWKYPEGIAVASFFSLYGLVIALMKDIPDIRGDKEHNISSFSVQIGAKNMLDISTFSLISLLSTAAVGLVSFHRSPYVAAALVASSVFVHFKKRGIDTEIPSEIFSYYLSVWNVFYLCYAMLPLI